MRITVSFRYVILWVLTHVHAQLDDSKSYKDVVAIERLVYYWRYLFAGLELYARYDQRVMIAYTHRNHFPMWYFVRPYTCELQNYRSHIDVVRIEWLLYCWRWSFSVYELYVRYKLPVMAPKTSQSLSDKPFVCSYMYSLKTTCHLCELCA